MADNNKDEDKNKDMKKLFTLLLLAISFQAFGQIQATLRPTGPSAPEPEDTLFLNEYPSDFLAFSLVRLDTNYTGSCIRVRRSSDNTEQDIGFTNNYLDTNSLKSFVGANDGYVVTWYNQADTLLNLDSIVNTPPRIIIAGDIQYEGSLPAIHFEPDSAMSLAASNTYTIGPDSIISGFGVVRRSDTLNTNLNHHTVRFELNNYKSTGSGTNSFVAGYSIANAELANQNLLDHSLIFNIIKTDSVYIYVNGNGPGVDDNPLFSEQNAHYQIGSGDTNNENRGTIQELIYWRDDKTTDRTTIRDARNTYYTIY